MITLIQFTNILFIMEKYQNLRNNLVRAVDKNEVKNLINKMIKTLNNEKNTLA